jgi:hypothetical protein
LGKFLKTILSMKFVGVPSSTAKAAATALAPGLQEEE